MKQQQSPKRIGVIDNLQDLATFTNARYESATASEVLAATGGNTGNVAFVYATRKILGNPQARISWGSDVAEVKRRFDHIVICCANQLGPHADLASWGAKLREFSLPVTLIGLGAQMETVTDMPLVPEGTRQFLDAVSELRDAVSSNIATRGRYTSKLLDLLGHESAPIGCPSVLISENVALGALLSAKNLPFLPRLAIAAGNPWHEPSSPLESMLATVAERTSGSYVVQHPLSMVQFALGDREAISPQAWKRFSTVYAGSIFPSDLVDWFRRNSALFVDSPTWMHALRRMDGVLGPRYHGVALGVQAGVPGCAIAVDGRVQELCETTRLKMISLEEARGLSFDGLLRTVAWTDEDAHKFDSNRSMLATEMRAFLEANGLEASQHLVRLTHSNGQSQPNEAGL